MPTILDWLGQPLPRALDGCSLVPWLRGDTPEPWRQGVMLEFDLRRIKGGTPLGLQPDEGGAACWRGAGAAYTHFAALPPLGYDLQTDPQELTNTGARPEAAAALLSHRIAHAERTLTGYEAGPGGLSHL